MNATTTHHCPVCSAQLHFVQGQELNPDDGVTVYCPSRTCPAQEVSGHAGNVNTAFKIIEQKFNRKFQQENE